MRITAPVEGFTGIVVGVSFTNGVGETDDQNLINYFDRHGYLIEERHEGAAPEEVVETGDANVKSDEDPEDSQPEPPANTKTSASKAAK